MKIIQIFTQICIHIETISPLSNMKYIKHHNPLLGQNWSGESEPKFRTEESSFQGHRLHLWSPPKAGAAQLLLLTVIPEGSTPGFLVRCGWMVQTLWEIGGNANRLPGETVSSHRANECFTSMQWSQIWRLLFETDPLNRTMLGT